MKQNDYLLLYYYRLNPTIMFYVIEEEYKKLIFSAIHQVCFNFNAVCFTLDDAYQEALLALVNALEGYKIFSPAMFASYLYRCVTSSTRLLMRKHLSGSFGLLDRSYSLSYPMTSDENVILMDVIAEEKVWYQPQIMARFYDLERDALNLVSQLSHDEQTIFWMRNGGYSYQEIAQAVKISAKKVDNVLQKIRRKVKALET